ncbi:hypothetical protein [Streptomyces virginiae]|uniref:HTH cro/C1-type domain-containing protein n=2 Tax=Streptomyces TaxID=1883 RepID=A0ABZ1T311_STRVG|nr:hypothetical protein [Streptomyces virginiae]WTB20292.1 hypothetical protein OG253_01545 [Streptomyces virginiae]
MSPQREINNETAAGRLALFLVALTRGTSVRDLADRFGRSSSSWGNYLNGSQLIPKPLVGKLVEAFTPPGARRSTASVQALELWKAADIERRAGRLPGGGELVRQHQRRDDALQQVIKYQALAANAEKHLAELRPMLAYTQSRLENAELQLKLGGEREQARVERRLGQAKERLSRVHVQQERARTRRMTAEEQQEFWMAEAMVAQEEISRLEREAQDLVVVPPGALEPVRADTADAVDDSDFEARLEHITVEGLHDDALIEEDLQPTPATPDTAELQVLLVGEERVQPLSNTEEVPQQQPPVRPAGHEDLTAAARGVQRASKVALDKPPTGNDVERNASDPPTQSQPAQAPRSRLPEEVVDGSRLVPDTRRLWGGTRAAIRLGLLEVVDEATPSTAVGATREGTPAPVDLWLSRYAKTPLGSVLLAPGIAMLELAHAARRAGANPALLLRICAGMSALGLSVFLYLIGQGVAAERDNWGTQLADVFVGIVFYLPPLYGGLRLMKIPNKPAWILAAGIHLTWSVLLLFDLFPWTALSFGTK